MRQTDQHACMWPCWLVTVHKVMRQKLAHKPQYSLCLSAAVPLLAILKEELELITSGTSGGGLPHKQQ